MYVLNVYMYVSAALTCLIYYLQPRLVPLFVRMIFHDCVGGCDGCIDMNNKGNAGMLYVGEVLP